MEQSAFMVFKTFDNALSANIVKGLLESCGIESYLSNENVIWAYPDINGVSLYIHREDFERATEALQSEIEDL